MIEDYKRPEFKIDGVLFRLKKSSPENTERVVEFFQEIVEDYGDVEDPEDISEDEDEKSLRRIVELIADPVGDRSLDDVNWRKVDRNKVEHYLHNGFF